MKKRILLSSLALIVLASAFAAAQTAEVKEKPPMYTYVSLWTFPRAQWAAAEKSTASDEAILQKALASGALVGYGNDVNLVHSAEGFSHDDWWSSTSMAGLLNVLDQFYKSGTATSPVMSSATRHSDAIYVSRFYNWRPGTYTGAYTHGSAYKLKPDAPDEAVETLSRHLVVPLLEKLLANGTIFEYEIDREAVHTESPAMFWIFYLCANADGIDKTNAAIRAALKANPLSGPAFDSMTDFTGHRDYLARTNATFR